MLSFAPIERTMASERGCTGSRSTRRFQWLSAGNTGQPASTAHVAVLPAGREVERGLFAHVLDLAHRRGVHAREPTRAEHVLAVVVERDPHAAPVHEVQLLLLLVVVAACGVARRNLDRVHAESGHAEPAPYLAEAGPVAERIDVRDGVAVALHDIVNLVSHGWRLNASAWASPGRPRPT